MIVVDTSVWIEYLARTRSPASNVFDDNLGREEIVLGDLILTEILQGFRDGPHIELVQATLANFRCESLCGATIAPLAAANCRVLRRKGITVRGTIDVVIATWCIENGARLLHNDRDFDRIAENLPLQLVD